jgi:hypothetical protein
MRAATLGKRILCLFIAIGYFFFSCFYVTRCPKHPGHTKTGSYFTLSNKPAKQNGPIISSATNSKSIPVLFHSHPRVISGKNLVALGSQFKLIRITELCPFRRLIQSDGQNKFRAYKVFYTANILSIIHTWKI